MKNKAYMFIYIFVLWSFLASACSRIAIPTQSADKTIATNTNDSSDSLISSTFILTSPDVIDGGTLPVEYTCDGSGSTLALTWSGAPEGTQSYAVIMHHIAPETIHWYWVLYDIPSSVTSLPKNTSGVGTLGNNINNERNEYSPPCSKGPGDKEYIYTVYALSAQPQVTTTPVNRAVMLKAIKDITLASAELHVVYARP
jgi:Raf kinase inhibitor-like YbhB/YbcL family protein